MIITGLYFTFVSISLVIDTLITNSPFTIEAVMLGFIGFFLIEFILHFITFYSLFFKNIENCIEIIVLITDISFIAWGYA